MKTNIINFIATLVLAFVLSQFSPWWSVMIAAFITALMFRLKHMAVFFIPFLAVAVLWITQAFFLGNANDFVLAKKIANLLPLSGNVAVLLVVTGIIGGIAAGVAGIFGKQCAALISKN